MMLKGPMSTCYVATEIDSGEHFKCHEVHIMAQIGTLPAERESTVERFVNRPYGEALRCAAGSSSNSPAAY